jgi:hypothetical protein
MTWKHEPDERDESIGVLKGPGGKPGHEPTVLLVQYLHHGKTDRKTSRRRSMISIQVGSAGTSEPAYCLLLEAAEAERVVGWLQQAIAMCREHGGQDPDAN